MMRRALRVPRAPRAPLTSPQALPHLPCNKTSLSGWHVSRHYNEVTVKVSSGCCCSTMGPKNPLFWVGAMTGCPWGAKLGYL